MFDCLGISALGVCVYDPSNPANIYFSIGEAIAALSITLIIPQFIRPIYSFRLATQFIRASHIYLLVFSGAACVVVAAIVPNTGVPRGAILAYPIVWELVGGLLFLFAFGALVWAVLRPARVKRGKISKFAKAAAAFLAHASEDDRTKFSKDLLENIESLIRATNFFSFSESYFFHHGRSAFFDFKYRREIEDAQFASSLLQFVAEPQFCETLVHRCPWNTAILLNIISEKQLHSAAAEDLVQEIGRQAIICPSSMLGREIGYKGFHAAPVLSQALFEDWFINSNYLPLSGLESGDLKGAGENAIRRYLHGLRSVVATSLRRGQYWDARSLLRTRGRLREAIREARHQVTADSENFGIAIGISSGVESLIRDTVKHLDGLDHATYEKLYAVSSDEREFCHLMNDISEAIMEVLESIGYDYEGLDDPFWSIALGIIREAFDKFGEQPDGMDPLQQRLAIKFIDKVKRELDWDYPTVIRVLLPVIGPYDEPGQNNPNSAFSYLKKAFYAELVCFKDLYEKDPEHAGRCLPKNVRYDNDNNALVQIYRRGAELSTKLDDLSIAPVSFYDQAIRRKLPN